MSRTPSCTFVFEMTGETAWVPDPSHGKEQPMAIASPARPREPVAQQWKRMA
jgi:hypothetical protein